MHTINESDLIRDLALAERPQERLEKLGVEALHDVELLALGVRSRSLRALETLLAQHPLAELVTMPFVSLSRKRGVGPAGAAAMLALAEIVKRTQKRLEPGVPVIQSMNDIIGQSVELRTKKKEYLMAFFLNARHQLITKEIVSIGTLTASLAHPREIFSPAIGKAAASVILVHNHPSGDPSPSEEDIRLTKRIAQAGHIMGIDLLDHLIIAESGCYSFKNAGQL